MKMISVAFIGKAWQDLESACEREGLTETDVVNRAVSLYEFVSAQRAAGRQLLLRDPVTGGQQLVRIH